MNKLKVFFFDDDFDEYTLFWKLFRFYWNKRFSEIELIHDSSKDYFSKSEDVFDLLLNNKFDYQLCIVDMLDAKVKENIGESIIKEIRETSNCVIVAISMGDATKFPTLKDDILNSTFADHFVHRSKIKNANVLDETFDVVIRKCFERNIITDPITLKYDQNPKLDNIISAIGESNIKSLYKQILTETVGIKTMDATYLAPGFSGAFVLQMNVHKKDKPPASHLIKINKDKNILLGEIKNRPPLGTYSPKLFVHYLPINEDKFPVSNDWYAIGAEFASNTVTLRDWLNSNPDNAKLVGVLEAIFFNGGMSVGYSKPFLSDKIQADNINLSTSRIARILLSLEELEDVCSHKILGKDSNWKVKAERIQDFLVKKIVFGKIEKSSISGSFYICQCHGDFHARNILVSKQETPQPTIIDTAEFGNFHWTTDYVRLIADFLLSSYDFGVNSHLWNKLPSWLSIGKSIIELNEITDSKIAGNSLTVAINWMISNFPKIFPFMDTPEKIKSHKWEFQLSMAIEFMRGAYRVDITVPKRVLALMLGYLALDSAEKSVKTHTLNS